MMHASLVLLFFVTCFHSDFHVSSHITLHHAHVPEKRRGSGETQGTRPGTGRPGSPHGPGKVSPWTTGSCSARRRIQRSASETSLKSPCRTGGPGAATAGPSSSDEEVEVCSSTTAQTISHGSRTKKQRGGRTTRRSNRGWRESWKSWKTSSQEVSAEAHGDGSERTVLKLSRCFPGESSPPGSCSTAQTGFT